MPATPVTNIAGRPLSEAPAAAAMPLPSLAASTIVKKASSRSAWMSGEVGSSGKVTTRLTPSAFSASVTMATASWSIDMGSGHHRLQEVDDLRQHLDVLLAAVLLVRDVLLRNEQILHVAGRRIAAQAGEALRLGPFGLPIFGQQVVQVYLERVGVRRRAHHNQTAIARRLVGAFLHPRGVQVAHWQALADVLVHQRVARTNDDWILAASDPVDELLVVAGDDDVLFEELLQVVFAE